MQRNMLQKMYFNDWIRIPVKFILTFFVLKVGYDYHQYLTAWRGKGYTPRFVFIP